MGHSFSLLCSPLVLVACNAQSQLFFTDNLDTSSDWSSSYSTFAPQWLSATNTFCSDLGGTPCVLLQGGTAIYRTISTVGYHSLRVVTETRQDLDDAKGGTDACYLEYRGSATSTWSRIETLDTVEPQQYVIPPLMNNDANFELKFGNTGADVTDQCYFDNLRVYGTPSTNPLVCPYYAPCDQEPPCLHSTWWYDGTRVDSICSFIGGSSSPWCSHDYVYQSGWSNCCYYTDCNTRDPTAAPSASPSEPPSRFPSRTPSALPSASPTNLPTKSPSKSPSKQPSTTPSRSPTAFPTPMPTASTSSPTKQPSASPAKQPISTRAPSDAPTNAERQEDVEDSSNGLNLFGLQLQLGRFSIIAVVCTLFIFCTCCVCMIFVCVKARAYRAKRSKGGRDHEGGAESNTYTATTKTRLNSDSIDTIAGTVHITHHKASPVTLRETPISRAPVLETAENVRRNPLENNVNVNIQQNVALVAYDNEEEKNEFEQVVDGPHDQTGVEAASLSSMHEVSMTAGQSLELITSMDVDNNTAYLAPDEFVVDGDDQEDEDHEDDDDEHDEDGDTEIALHLATSGRAMRNVEMHAYKG